MARSHQQALVSLLHDHGLRAHSITPHFVACWNHFAPRLGPHTALATLNEGVLTLALRRNGHLAELRCLPASEAAHHQPGWLQASVQREALRLGWPVPDSLALAAPLPPAWRHPAQPGVSAPGLHAARLADTAAVTAPPPAESRWQCLPLVTDTAPRTDAEQLARTGLGV
jgi:hypothetical protein